MPTDAELKRSALAYARKGLPVFPCQKKNKKPCAKVRSEDATTDPDQIIKWWGEEYPGASIGLPMGVDSGMWVLDVNEPGGSKSLAKLESKHGQLPDTLIQQTGGGGVQFFFHLPPNGKPIKNTSQAIAPHINTQGNKGYAIIPPSGHASGGEYIWLGNQEITMAPAWLIDLIDAAPGPAKKEEDPAPKPAPQEFTEKNPPPLEGSLKVQTTFDLKNAVKSYIEMDKRVFRLQDLFNDLAVRDRTQKKNISGYLGEFIQAGLIERVSGQRGVFVCKEHEMVQINFLHAADGDIESVIKLPLGLEQLGVQVMPGNTVIIAGESNAGKTTFTLNVAYENLKAFGGKFDSVRYFSSEMGPQEMHTRIKAFGEPLDSWAGLQVFERSSAFHQVIDPDGLNIIDFLEVQNEFYLVGEWIKQIHETLNNGVAVVALQKKKGADYGRGAELSLEKPRLYVSIAEVVKGISSCKIIKCKNYSTDRNPNGMEKDFRIKRRGSEIVEMTDWQFVNMKKRYALNNGYETMLKKESAEWIEKSIPEQETAYLFMVEGEERRINWRDVKKWRKDFEWMDVDEALLEISNESKEKSFLGKNWFWQVHGLLKKRYVKIMEQRGEQV